MGEGSQKVQAFRDKVRALGWNARPGDTASRICELLSTQILKAQVRQYSEDRQHPA